MSWSLSRRRKLDPLLFMTGPSDWDKRLMHKERHGSKAGIAARRLSRRCCSVEALRKGLVWP
jgi:hypothetical protein